MIKNSTTIILVPGTVVLILTASTASTATTGDVLFLSVPIDPFVTWYIYICF